MILSQKTDLRKKILKNLKTFIVNFPQSEKLTLAENLCEKVTSLPEYKAADFILAYLPTSMEADCKLIILNAMKNAKKVAVPKVDLDSLKAGQSRMDFYLLKNEVPLEDQLEKGTYGIFEPKSDLEKVTWGVAGLEGIDICPAEGVGRNEMRPQGETSPFMIVPGLAFTKDGKRLGHGKGFYDIYIEKIRNEGINPFLCGLCFPCQLLENLPTDEKDVLMDRVIF